MAVVVLGIGAAALGVLMRTISSAHQANQVSSQSKSYSVVMGQVAAHGLDPQIVRPIQPQSGMGTASVQTYAEVSSNSVVTPTQTTGSGNPSIMVSVVTSGIPSGISGVTAVPEVQEVILPAGVTGGTFSLSWGGVATSSLASNATASQVSAALNLLSTVSAVSGVTVTGAAGGPYAVTWSTAGNRSMLSADSTHLVYQSAPANSTFTPSAMAIGSLSAQSATALSGTQRQNMSGSAVVSVVIPTSNQDSQARGRVYGRTIQLAPATGAGATVVPPVWPGMLYAPIPSSYFNPSISVSLTLPITNPVGTVYYYTTDGTTPSGTPSGPTGTSIPWTGTSPLAYLAPGSGAAGLPATLAAIAVAPSGAVSAVALVKPVVQLQMTFARATGSVGSAGNTVSQFTYVDLTGDSSFSGTVNTSSASYDPIVLSTQGSVPSTAVSIVYSLDGTAPSVAYGAPFAPPLSLASWSSGVPLQARAVASGTYASQYVVSPVLSQTLTRVSVALVAPTLSPLPASGNVAVSGSIFVELGGSPVVGAPSSYFDTTASVVGVSNAPATAQQFTDSSIVVPSVGS